MALVTCTHCKKSISEQAVVCPQCGNSPQTMVAECAPSSPVVAHRRRSFLKALLIWTTRHPLMAGFAFCISLGAIILTVALSCDDDALSNNLAGISVVPTIVLALASSIWRALPDTTISGKLQSVGWCCLVLLLLPVAIWLLAYYRMAWYIVGVASLLGAGYVAYRVWQQPVGPKEYSSRYWWGVHFGTFLILAGTVVDAQRHQRPRPTREAPAQVIASPSEDWAMWKLVGFGLILFGISIIKESSRKAVLDELRHGNNMPTNPADISPSSSEVPTAGISAPSPTPSPESST